MGMPSVAPDVIMDFEQPKTDHGFLRETFLKKRSLILSKY